MKPRPCSSRKSSLSSQFHREKLFRVMINYIAPVCIVAILISSVFQLV